MELPQACNDSQVEFDTLYAHFLRGHVFNNDLSSNQFVMKPIKYGAVKLLSIINVFINIADKYFHSN